MSKQGPTVNCVLCKLQIGHQPYISIAAHQNCMNEFMQRLIKAAYCYESDDHNQLTVIPRELYDELKALLNESSQATLTGRDAGKH